jgi:hypothetical protein
MTYALTVGGMPMHHWFKFLDTKFPGTHARPVLTKVALDQIISAPLGLALFFAGVSTLEGAHLPRKRFRIRTYFCLGL